MDYLILGSNGMAGHMITQFLLEKGHNVTGFAKVPSYHVTTIIGDATSREDVQNTLRNTVFDVVINCIGVLNKEVDRNISTGIYLNSYLPHLIADTLIKSKKKLIHISTDCVFNGNKGYYTEFDIPDETSLYGRSKALGEVNDGKNLTLRTSIIGPELKENGIGLFHWFMNQEEKVQGYANVIWAGITTLQLAKSIEMLGDFELSGIYHLVNNSIITKHDLISLFNRYFRDNVIEIQKNNVLKSDKSLLNTRKEFEFNIPSYETMVKEMNQWIRHHQELYKQYI